MYVVKTGTRIGPYHLRRSEPNQDAHGTWEQDGVMLLLAADGAGSQDLSHLGAQLVIDEFRRGFGGEEDLAIRLRVAIDHARQALLSHPDHARMGCTLSALALGPQGWAALTVGDAFCVVATDEGFRLVTAPPSENAGETTFVNSETLHTVEASGHGAARAGAVATDGFELVGLKDGEPFPAFWSYLFTHGAQQAFTVDSVLDRMEEQGRLVDDSTLVMALRDE